ncbi:MAG: transcriptional regulator [Deltaproteobacteria bacterium]|nr:transcriptional regulator [Deltaproteobacteria bacterium]
MAREAQLTRTWQLITSLDHHQNGLTVEELRDELRVTERTVYRDLAALQEAGFPIFSDAGSGVARRRFVEGYRFVKALPLNVKEAAALALAGDLVGSFHGTFFADAMKSAFEKVRGTLSPEALDYARSAVGILGVSATKRHNYEKKAAILATLHEATRLRRQVEIVYESFSSNRVARRIVDPYTLHLHGGTIYLIAYCHRRRDVRQFVVDRVRSAKTLTETFEVQEGYDPERHLASAFKMFRGKPFVARICFERRAARYLRERTYHPSQTIRDLKGGAIEVTLEVSGVDQLAAWVASFGGDATVLEPDKLRRAVVRRAKGTLGRYGR